MNKNVRLENKLKFLILILAVIQFISVSITSVGYHHYDEHYQIVDFAEYRLGNSNEVSWEYKKQIRSALQPVLCMAFFSVLRAVGINDHFQLVFFLRLVTAFLSVLSITALIKTSINSIDKQDRAAFIFFSYFLWFLPYIGVRFSSETWAGICCTFAVVFTLRESKNKSYLNPSLVAGLFSGFSILFRFQSLIFVMGLLFWRYFIKRDEKNGQFTFIAGLVCSILFGIFLDTLFYGNLTLTIFNYFLTNILEGVAAYFGKEPWYEIFRYILIYPILPIGLLLLICLCATSVERRNILTWTVLPFILLHTIPSHKELRFLFPMANFAPLIIFTGIGSLKKRFNLSQSIVTYTLIILAVFNTLGLIVITTQSPRNGKIALANYIHKKFTGNPVNIISSFESAPYDPELNFKHNFYKSSNVEITYCESIWTNEFNKTLVPSKPNLLILSRQEFTGKKTTQKLDSLGFQLLFKTQLNLNKLLINLYDASLNDQQLQLYLYKPQAY